MSKEISPLVAKASAAVSEALAIHDASLRAYENAAIEKDEAYRHLVRAREDLEDVLRVEAGLESEHKQLNADKTDWVPRFTLMLGGNGL